MKTTVIILILILIRILILILIQLHPHYIMTLRNSPPTPGQRRGQEKLQSLWPGQALGR